MKTANDKEINQNHLILRFIDFDFSPDLITKNVGLKPLSVGKKGEEYFVGSQKRILKIRDCNHWDYEWKVYSNEFIGDITNKFFNEILIPRKELIKEIGLSCQTTRLVIVQYYFTGHNPGFNFKKEQIQVLAEINAEIDMDIYCLCEDE